MNAKIKELYLQAHMVREYPEDDPMYGGNPPTVYWGGDKSAEKFAELIVKECMACSTWVGEVNKTPVEPIHTAHAINVRIKKHFGVER